MMQTDTVIKSGFALRSSAVHCYKVMSLHLPGKADIEVSNRGRRQKKTQTESLKGGKEALIPGGSQSLGELVSCTDRRWRKTRPRPGAYRPRVLEPVLHFTDTCAPHSEGLWSPQPLSRLTLTVASWHHVIPAVAVFTPEGPHGIDTVPFPTDVWPQTLIDI